MSRGLRELLIAYLVAVGINYYFLPSDPGFLEIHPNPLILLTVLYAGRYGFTEGLASGLIGSLYYVVGALMREDGLILELLLGPDLLVVPVIMVALGMMIGSWYSTLANRCDYFRGSLSREVDESKKMRENLKKLSDSHLQMEKRLAGQGLGTYNFSTALWQLYEMADEELLHRVGEMIETFVQAKSYVIFAPHREASHYRVVVRRGAPLSDGYCRAILENPVVEASLRGRGVVSLSELVLESEEELPDADPNENEAREVVFYCGVVAGNDGKVQALLVVDDIEFVHFNVQTYRVFDTIVNALGVRMKQLAQVDELQRSTTLHPVYRVEREEYLFGDLYRALQDTSEQNCLLVRAALKESRNRDRKEALWILLAHLTSSIPGRCAWLEGEDSFLLWLQGDGESAQYQLRQRFESYDLTGEFVELSLISCKLSLELVGRGSGQLREYFSEQLQSLTEGAV